MVDEKDVRIEELEKELFQLREHLRSTATEQEAATRKLQLTNDQLSVLNQQLTALSERVEEAKEFSEAIISNLHEPVLVLDKNLRVTSANNAFYKTFQVNEAETEGKLIYDLGNKQWNIPALRSLLENILPNKESLFDFEVEHNFQNIGQRTVKLNAREVIRKRGDERLILLAIADVTITKQADIKNSLYSGIINSTHEAVISKTLNGSITSWNKGAEQIFGYKAEEIIGENIRLLIPMERMQEEEMVIGRIKNDETISNYNTVRVRKDGKRVNISITVAPIKDKDGQIIGASKIAHDITEEIEARKKIVENEAKLQSLIAAAPIAIGLFIGRDLVIENPNQQFIDIVGKGPGIAGMRLTDAMPELVEHGQPYLKILDDVFTSGKTYESLGDPVNIVRNGVMHHGFYNIYYVPLFDSEGKVYGIMDIATDVTEDVNNRKKIEESEAYFRSLTDTVPAIIWITEPDGSCSYLNRNWYNYTGQTEEEAKGFGWLNATHHDDKEEAGRIFVEANAEKKSFSLLYRLRTKSGEYRWAKDSGSPKFSREGIFEGYIGTVVDVHEEKLAEEKIRDSETRFRSLADESPMFVFIIE
ncbi:MAG: PAS domain S-box protein, partial [Bacteroidota bacterium]